MREKRNFEITDAKGGAAFTVRVVTRAVDTEIVSANDDGSLRIRLKASPAGDPAANQELVNFLAERLSVSPEQIEIVAGMTGREKVIAVEGITTADLEARLAGDLES